MESFDSHWTAIASETIAERAVNTSVESSRASIKTVK